MMVIEVPKKPIRFILSLAGKFRLLCITAVCVVVTSALLGQFISYFFKLIIDASEAGDSRKVVLYALLYPIAHFVVQSLYRANGFLAATITNAMKKYTNDLLVRYVINHSHAYFSDRFAGSLLTKIRNVVGAVEQFIPEMLGTHIPALVSFVVTATVICNADTYSGLLFVALAATLVGLNQVFAKTKKLLSRQASRASTRLSGSMVDMLTNMDVVRQYVRASSEMSQIESLSGSWVQASRANWFYTEKTLAINSVIILLFSVPIFYQLVERWGAGDITTGFFVFIIALYAQIMHTLLFIGRAFNHTARALGEMEEGLSDILLSYDVVDLPNAQRLKLQEGKVEWQDVTFKYEENTVFDRFNLTIAPGQRIGLVGQSGAGKTTFVSLLLRQHDISEGAIMIDGQDIKGVTQDSLREQIAVVPQEPMLFHRSIRENIAYGKPDATEEEIIEVAKKAEAHAFISALPKGYDTLVGERGIKLSGGQKQRVAIARAMLKNAPVLVLDEATSALDSESEVAIQKALHELMVGKTVIAIAHRLSTLREMDRIIVLEKGQIVQDGSHDALVKKKGIYARLWKHQAGGFLTE